MAHKISVMLIAALIAVGAHALYAQELLKIKASCNYYGSAVSGDVYGFTSDAEAQTAVSRIMKYTGLPQNFVIMAANVDSAEAGVQENPAGGIDRYLLYNQDFMLLVKDLTHTDWAAISIMAHEIGHHLAGHTLQPGGSRPKEELEADKFSAFVLYRMGATLAEAQIVMQTIASDAGSATHPPKSARLAAITNGWIQAREQNPITPIPTVSAPTIRLRKEPRTISEEAAQESFGLVKIPSCCLRPRHYIENQYEDMGEVIVDHTTGLMWQKGGASTELTYAEAQGYVKQLNAHNFAWHNDWRLPTIPELMSLLEPKALNGILSIDPIFDQEQDWCWSADTYTSDDKRWYNRVWGVSFISNYVSDYARDEYTFHVRAVRSLQ